ncbi:MAG: transcriptional regulator BetI [Deltaproteobacteria bacterium ADurb.Bin510]|nr:MAG: transcriptional regulator BetI [Deltaproteobacteria bacterium ADurb.Bin510]
MARNANNTMAQKIIDHALEIIDKEGFEALTMRHLASRMGTSAPNIYNYYASKDELFCAIRIQGFESLALKLHQAYQLNAEPCTRVRAMLNAYLEFGAEHRSCYQTIFNRPKPIGNNPKRIADYMELEKRIARKIPQLIQRAIRELNEGRNSSFSDSEINLSILHIWSLLHGTVCIAHGMNPIMEDSAEMGMPTLIDKLAADLSQGRLPAHGARTACSN